METKVLEILKNVLPSNCNIIVLKRTTFYSTPFLKIMFSASNSEINNVSEQYPQAVSLRFDLDTMELAPQCYAGMGGQCIYRKPNRDNEREKYLAMCSVKIPFKKPKKEEKFVLSAIERFAQNWVNALKENRKELMYQDIVDYDKLLGV